MTTIEILLAVLENVRGLLIAAATILAVTTATVLLFTLFNAIDGHGRYGTEEERSRAATGRRLLVRAFLPSLVVASLLACVPSLDDLWRVRINMLKFAVASPENVQKAGDHIETIVKGLECKYLGACGEKKEEGK